MSGYAEECTSRKRRPGAAVPAAPAETIAERQLQEIRLPASTMLFSRSDVEQDKQVELPLLAGPGHEFSISHCDARQDVASDAGPRVLQFKPQKPLRVLRIVSTSACDLPSDAVPMSADIRQELLTEAESRGLDGVLFSEGRVGLLHPEEQVVLIDDDKREGLAQQLLTDMFLKMSLR